MQNYEYKAVPAPTRAKRFKGVKGSANRFAMVISELMNDLASDGWEYLRSDSLPMEEKAGLLKGRVETYQTILVFRREKPEPPEMAGLIEDQSQAPSPVEPVAPAPVTNEDDFDYPQDPPLTTRAGQDDDFPYRIFSEDGKNR